MKTEKAYTESEVNELVAKAIKQDREFQAQVLRGLPILGTDVRQQWIEEPSSIAEGLWGLFCPVAGVVSAEVPAQNIPAIPVNGEEFELELDGDAIDPLQMVRDDSYTGEWKFNGPKVTGKQKGTFKLMSAGCYCANLAAVKEKLPQETPFAEGQWREAFKAKYPKHDGKGPIGFAGSEWVFPLGFLHFPYVSDDGHSSFGWVGLDFYAHWRWLVRVK